MPYCPGGRDRIGHPDVIRHGRGYRAYVTLYGDGYTSKTYATVGEAIEAADHIRHTLESKINHYPAKKGNTHVGK